MLTLCRIFRLLADSELVFCCNLSDMIINKNQTFVPYDRWIIRNLWQSNRRDINYEDWTCSLLCLLTNSWIWTKSQNFWNLKCFHLSQKRFDRVKWTKNWDHNSNFLNLLAVGHFSLYVLKICIPWNFHIIWILSWCLCVWYWLDNGFHIF